MGMIHVFVILCLFSTRLVERTKRMARESIFQKGLIREIKQRLPGCLVLKNDPNHIQGIPDLTVLYQDRWAFLEVKKSAKEAHQPNQDYYIEKANAVSFGAFIFPENKEHVLHDLELTLNPGGSARLP